MASQPIARLSPEEYLAFERASDLRHEYYAGEIVLMSGATRNHGRIVLAAASRLEEQLRGQTCETAANDLRLWSQTHQAFMYPDIVVTCGPDRFPDKRRDTITDATVVIEILSPSTKNFDRGEKFLFYRSLPSFSEYLLLGQDTIRAEHHVRAADGFWLLREYTSAADRIDLKSIGCQLQLGPLYERVSFAE